MINIRLKNTTVIISIIVLAILVVLLIFGAAVLFSSIAKVEISSSKGGVALIYINGMIVADDHTSMLAGSAVKSTDIIKFIERAKKDSNVKGVIFEINSPGGSAVATDEIAQAIKELREETNKATVAWIREVGASGGYWIASTAEHIVANRMSITGSIGVMASYLELSGLLDAYNITYQRMVAGEHKDMGSPLRQLSDVEKVLFQEQLDQIHDYFIEEVAKNRNMKKEDVKSIADGSLLLGVKAKELGLVDELGGKKEAVKYIEDRLNITAVIIEYKEPPSLLSMLTKIMGEHGFNVGKGLGSTLEVENKGIIKT